MDEYPIEAQEHDYAEYVNELADMRHADLVAKYLELSERYDDLTDRHSRTTMYVCALALIVAMFVSLY